MRSLEMLRHVALALVLLGVFALQAEAGMMGHERTGTLTGTAGHHAAGAVVLAAGEGGAVLTLEEIAVDKVPDGRVFPARDGDYRQGVEIGRATLAGKGM